MYKDYADLHTHTIASGHAHNTIGEMVAAAKEKGLGIYAMTEHGAKMHNSCKDEYFANLKFAQRSDPDLQILFGIELNILDHEGHVDLPEEILAEMDVVIASMHFGILEEGRSAEENTACYEKVMDNPYVNIIGHPDDGHYPIDYMRLAKAAKEKGVLLELNNSSLAPTTFRLNCHENCTKLLEACKIYKNDIILSSDAHAIVDVGNHSRCMELMKEVDFPLEQVVNFDPERLKSYLNFYNGKKKPC